MKAVDLSPAAVTLRLRALSAACDLRAGRRLATKVDMSPVAVTRRLTLQAQLRTACLAWGAVGRKAGLARGSDRSPMERDPANLP